MNKYMIFFLKETLCFSTKNIEKALNHFGKGCDLHEIDELINAIDALSCNKLATNKIKEIKCRGSMDHQFKISCREFDDIECSGVKIISKVCPSYPSKLNSLSSAPLLLYCLGDTLLLTQLSIAVIGSRKATENAGIVAARLSEYFSKRGVTVVSGLALNIDSIAHRNSYLHEGRTIAVVVDVSNIYPSINKALAQKIIANNGLLLAENKPGVLVKPYHFISRDRIQSALSSAVFPIETCKNGGTMHAVKAASKLKIDLFIPDYTKMGYQKNSPQLAGMLELEKKYLAKKFDKSNYEDILGELQDD